MSTAANQPDEQIARFLDLLADQTVFGNVTWKEVLANNSYAYISNDSMVSLYTRDSDGELPFVLDVGYEERITHRWVCYGPRVQRGDPGDTDTDPAPEWVASRVRKLFDLVSAQFFKDPIESLIKELEDMPPF